MKIKKTDFVRGAARAEGIVVVIDVFRAFSTACYCFARGAERVIPVGSIQDAFVLGKKIEGSVLVGERGGRKLLDFDYGNSPTEINTADLHGKTVIHTTHAGTQGLVSATSASELLTGAFVNARATCEYIKSRSPELVTLVRMGLEAKVASDEDTLCADYLESLLLDRDFDADGIEPVLRKSPFSERFFDPAKPWNPRSDFEHCLRINIFDFALQANKDGRGRLFLKTIRCTNSG